MAITSSTKLCEQVFIRKLETALTRQFSNKHIRVVGVDASSRESISETSTVMQISRVDKQEVNLLPARDLLHVRHE